MKHLNNIFAEEQWIRGKSRRISIAMNDTGMLKPSTACLSSHMTHEEKYTMHLFWSLHRYPYYILWL